MWSQGFDRFGEFGLAGYVAVLGVDEGGGGEVVEVREGGVGVCWWGRGGEAGCAEGVWLDCEVVCHCDSDFWEL